MIKQLFLIFSLVFSINLINAMQEENNTKSKILQNARNLKNNARNLLETLNDQPLTINIVHLNSANNLVDEYHSIKQEAQTKDGAKIEHYLGKYVKPILRDIYKHLGTVFNIENPFIN